MRYYDSHRVCISRNTVLFISPCPGVVYRKSPVQLCMSEFWRKNYSKICLKQWSLMWVNTFFKAFKNPFVKNVVFLFFFFSFSFFSLIQDLHPAFQEKRIKKYQRTSIAQCTFRAGDLQWIYYKWAIPHGKTNTW